MRLVYYLPSLEASGGLERIITFKANYFAEQGNEVTIITSELGDRKPYFPLSPQIRHIDLGVAFDYPYSQSRLIKLLQISIPLSSFPKKVCQSITGTPSGYYHIYFTTGTKFYKQTG